MSGAMCAMMGGAVVGGREPASGDYFDASNRVTVEYWAGHFPPYSSSTRRVFRWGGADVSDSGVLPYPGDPPAVVAVGAYTYYTSGVQSVSGSEPEIALYAIYRVGTA